MSKVARGTVHINTGPEAVSKSCFNAAQNSTVNCLELQTSGGAAQ